MTILAWHGSQAHFTKFDMAMAGAPHGRGMPNRGWGLYLSADRIFAEFIKFGIPPGLPGVLYLVEIDAEVVDLLDWDVPLSEQPAIAAKLQAAGHDFPPSATGADVVRALGENPEGSARLLAAGIPGTRYFSLYTRNYAMFDANLLTILWAAQPAECPATNFWPMAVVRHGKRWPLQRITFIAPFEALKLVTDASGPPRYVTKRGRAFLIHPPPQEGDVVKFTEMPFDPVLDQP